MYTETRNTAEEELNSQLTYYVILRLVVTVSAHGQLREREK
jgi:hypothetical protein